MPFQAKAEQKQNIHLENSQRVGQCARHTDVAPTKTTDMLHTAVVVHLHGSQTSYVGKPTCYKCKLGCPGNYGFTPFRVLWCKIQKHTDLHHHHQTKFQLHGSFITYNLGGVLQQYRQQSDIRGWVQQSTASTQS